jgi:hypothetical protein
MRELNLTTDHGRIVFQISDKNPQNIQMSSTLGIFEGRGKSDDRKTLQENEFAAACDGLETMLLELVASGIMTDTNVDTFAPMVQRVYETLCDKFSEL